MWYGDGFHRLLKIDQSHSDIGSDHVTLQNGGCHEAGSERNSQKICSILAKLLKEIW